MSSYDLETFQYDIGDESPRFSEFFELRHIIARSNAGVILAVKYKEDGQEYALKVRSSQSLLRILDLQESWSR